jgi:diacylglycerol kinase (ATP)
VVNRNGTVFRSIEQRFLMKLVKLLHNPKAGDEEHDKEMLVSLLKENGFECTYVSSKEKDWNISEPPPDFIAVAGGDGTVRKVSKELLQQTLIDKIWPIAVLPFGTANNIAKTLGIEGKTEDIIKSWQKEKIKKYDIGRVVYNEEVSFFIESFGYGIFPYLMKQMIKTGNEEIEDPEKKIKAALKLLHEITLSYEPRYCRLEIDGADHSGKFLLAEIMNTQSIGPNLVLAPKAATDDGILNVVLVAEKDKDKFAEYLLSKLNGKEKTYKFSDIKAKQVKISWEGTHIHADDKVIKLKNNTEVNIELKPGLLEFMVT